jgi:hypothetical protein
MEVAEPPPGPARGPMREDSGYPPPPPPGPPMQQGPGYSLPYPPANQTGAGQPVQQEPLPPPSR